MWNRIIDSNFNRAAEAIKTLEDILRFELESSELAGSLKTLRSELESHHQANWLAERDSALERESEEQTDTKDLSLLDLIRLNIKQAAQALKIIHDLAQVNKLSELASLAEEGRNQIYILEKDLWLKFSNQDSKKKLLNSHIYLITGRAENEPFESLIYKVKTALAGGVQVVQLREKSLEGSQICYLAHQIKELCHKAGALFIINDRPDIALAVEADGVHIGQSDLDLSLVRKIMGRNKLIGISAHSKETIQLYQNSEADYLSIGPVFSTPTKADRQGAGIDLIEWAAQNIHHKVWFAIGGIHKDNIHKLLKAGAKRFAFVKYLAEATDQAQAVNTLKNQFSKIS